MNMPLVSIVTPIYNGALYLDNAVKSVLAQTYSNWELLLVDDGSTDSSYQKALKWTKYDTRISVLHHPNHENRGVSAARNLAFFSARGLFTATLDCDDEWLPEKLEKQVEILLQHPELIFVFCQAETIDEHGTPLSENPEKLAYAQIPPVIGDGPEGRSHNGFELMAKSQLSTPCLTVLARTKEVTACGGCDETLEVRGGQDWLLFMTLAERGPIYFRQEVLAKYRVHSGSYSLTTRRNWRQRTRVYLQCPERLLKKFPHTHHELLSQMLVENWNTWAVHGAFHSHPIVNAGFLLQTSFRVLSNKDVLSAEKHRCLRILLQNLVRLPSLVFIRPLKRMIKQTALYQRRFPQA